MTVLLLALIAQTGQVAKPLPTVNIPTARFQMVYPVQFVPTLTTEQISKTRKADEGGASHFQWGVEVNKGLCTLHYTKFSATEPPKKTLTERAESMFRISKDFAEGMLKIDENGDWMKIHEDKFSNRKVTTGKVAGYDAVTDAHEDLRSKTIRRQVAWGDQKEQWVLELSLDNSSAMMKDVMAQIVDSIKILKPTPEQLKALPLGEQTLTGMGFSISAPGVFAMFARPVITAARPAKQGITASLPLGDGFDVNILYDAYDDAVKSDTSQVAEKLLSGMKLPGTDIKASKIDVIARGAFSGHLVRADYLENGVGMYGLSAVLTKAGIDLIVHIHVRKDLGGKEKADAILDTLKAL